MAALHHPWALAFGILGNIISFMVYLAPVPTFYRICKKKSTEGFQAVPYVIALFSAMLMIYYALVKTNSFLLITINGIGCFIETVYIVLFLIFAPKRARISALKLLLLLNVLAYCIIVGLTFVLLKGSSRVRVIGWINVGFSICVFAAPLSIIRLVIRTRSVEFMPFNLSFFLTVSAVVWFTYGLLIRDPFVAAPNILGFLFGIAQMVLYIIYKDAKQLAEFKDPEKPTDSQVELKHAELVIKLSTTMGSEVHPVETKQVAHEGGEAGRQRPHEEADAGDEEGVASQAEIELSPPHA